MIAAINAALARGLIGLEPEQNWWPGYEAWPATNSKGHVFGFTINNNIPALAYVADAGWDELYFNVALWPTAQARNWIFCGMIANGRGGDIGDVVASGWVERRDGRYLQPSPWLFFCRRERRQTVAELDVEPRGYRDRGRFRM